jgi:hypothetical protein
MLCCVVFGMIEIVDCEMKLLWIWLNYSYGHELGQAISMEIK